MSNLLPKQNKKNIKIEYLLRLTVVFMIFSIFSLLFAALFLIPSYFLSKNKVSLAEDRIKSIKTFTDNNQKTVVSQFLMNINQKIEAINTPNGAEIIDAINTVIREKHNSIKIFSFSYKKNLNEKTLFIEGNSLERDNLIAFSEDLKATGEFSKVDLPISNLAKSNDIDFIIELTIKDEG